MSIKDEKQAYINRMIAKRGYAQDYCRRVLVHESTEGTAVGEPAQDQLNIITMW